MVMPNPNPLNAHVYVLNKHAILVNLSQLPSAGSGDVAILKLSGIDHVGRPFDLEKHARSETNPGLANNFMIAITDQNCDYQFPCLKGLSLSVKYNTTYPGYWLYYTMTLNAVNPGGSPASWSNIPMKSLSLVVTQLHSIQA